MIDGVVRIGPRPVLLSRYVAHHGVHRMRRRRLRRTYATRIASPPAGARLLLRPLELPPVEQLAPALLAPADRLLHEAEAVLLHEVDYLGSGPTRLGTRIDWHEDFKSGSRWPREFYLDLLITRPTDSSDAKVPWELSRGHQFLTLARAARLFRDERFAEELERQLAGWLEDNPTGVGINWANPMEVGIRAVNWIWALRTLSDFRDLDQELEATVVASLQSHGRHIAANLEGTPYLRSNHYLSNILGLLALGTALDGDPDAGRWTAFARRELEAEIFNQVLDDGVGFEASLSYHGLSLELLLLARSLCTDAGLPLSAEYDDRLRRMLEVSRSLRHPAGRIPLFGDSDSGRVLPAGFERPPTHDHLLWLGAALLGEAPPPSDNGSEEVAWTLGIAAWQRAKKLSPGARVSNAFADGGLYVLRGNGVHLAVRCGGVGQNGNGGHAHNDLLSYEFGVGQPVVVDAGTYAYTADTAARNRFRSTSAHNGVEVAGEEINPIDPARLFRLRGLARPSVETFVDGPACVELVASHDGYRRLPEKIVHRRTVRLAKEDGVVEIHDELGGVGGTTARSFLHLASGVHATQTAPLRIELRNDDIPLAMIEFQGVDAVSVEPGSVSSRFGVIEPASVLVARVRAELPIRFGYRIEPVWPVGA